MQVLCVLQFGPSELLPAPFQLKTEPNSRLGKTKPVAGPNLLHCPLCIDRERWCWKVGLKLRHSTNARLVADVLWCMLFVDHLIVLAAALPHPVAQ